LSLFSHKNISKAVLSLAKKILVVDDEVHIVELLKMNLKQHGYEPICAYSGQEALRNAEAYLPDLILLDIMMPDIDGIETCRRLKQNQKLRKIPVIMLTAKTEETDKVIGLSVGADDYITKPFSLRELFARINVALRRQYEEEDNLISAGDIKIDTAAHLIKIAGRDIDLTLTEFNILKLLVNNVGKVITREQLINYLSADDPIEPSTLNVHILKLRRKIGDFRIETVRGVGYRLKY
jgi:two-component system alkaline phosphatase synthesis response regulator PhoP